MQRSKELVARYILFVLWPFVSLIFAVKNFHIKRYRWIILLFFIFFALVFIPENAGDGSRHARLFLKTAERPISELFDIINDVIQRNSGAYLDIYTPIVNYTLSRVSNWPNTAFAFHALVFGFFYLKSIEIVYDEFPLKRYYNLNSLVFFVFFVTLISIHRISFVRFYTAGWLFFYMSYQYFKTKERKYLLWSTLSVLIHLSILPLFGLLLLHSFLGNRTKIYTLILVFSFITPDFFNQIFEQLQTSRPEGLLEDKLNTYADKDFLRGRVNRLENLNWYAKYKFSAIIFSLFSVALIFVIKFWRGRQDDLQNALLSYVVLLLAFYNFITATVGASERYFLLVALYILVYLFRHFQINKVNQVSSMTLLCLGPMLLWIVMEIRLIAQYANPMLLVGNPLVAIIIEFDQSIWDMIN